MSGRSDEARIAGRLGGEPAAEARAARGAGVLVEISPWLEHPVKRIVDAVISALALAVCFPAMLLIAASIRLDSGGPVLFRQRRLGWGGRSFWMVKFRTMHRGSDERLEQVLADDGDAERTWEAHQKLPTDPRVTRVGVVLRRLSLDELPQLWNVLRGDMALVGPRPILPEQREIYGEAFPAYARGRPGLTGLWQVSGRNRLSFLARVRCDERYRGSCSPVTDVHILLRTVVAVVTRDGAW